MYVGFIAYKQDAPFRATVLEPIGKLNSYYAVINSAIDKRNHKLLDYDSARAKVKKLVEKPADDPVRLPRVSALFVAAVTYERGRSVPLGAYREGLDRLIWPYCDVLPGRIWAVIIRKKGSLVRTNIAGTSRTRRSSRRVQRPKRTAHPGDTTPLRPPYPYVPCPFSLPSLLSSPISSPLSPTLSLLGTNELIKQPTSTRRSKPWSDANSHSPTKGTTSCPASSGTLMIIFGTTMRMGRWMGRWRVCWRR